MKGLLDRFGIGNDPDWISIVLFVRNLLSRLSIYTDDKKAEIQREIFGELAKKDFSEEHFEVVLAMLDMYVMQTIGAQDLEDALTREKRSASQLLNEMNEVIDTMNGSSERQNRKLDAFKEQTVGVIESGEDQSVIVAKVRQMFQELIVEFKEEAKLLQSRALMLERSANFDPLLTELHNRRAFDAFLNDAILAQRKKPGSLCLLMIDVDLFKNVNDTYGHQAGDDVLRALARILTAHVIQYNGFPARYGGEELVVVIQDMPLDIAVLKAEALRTNVEQYGFRIRNEGRLTEAEVSCTVSIGVAQWQKGWDAGQLVRAADTALYRAKDSGRNQVCTARPS
ncbi:GGDEF domain-containing protein [Pseudodesulfovibrio piezophilus]|nr:GGDEF domain-containing protein [Pseudodesulfovibrio piezophilus]